jgi:hypothetical protein
MKKHRYGGAFLVFEGVAVRFGKKAGVTHKL